ncbi:MAG: CoA transferase [Burkholderiaceae bacterium]|nr:CoA transferase [Burkholderiaceae bacterium]
MRPLSDLRVAEFATVGGVPFCGWWLAQQGAQITRIVNPRPPELGVPVDATADIGAWGRDDLTLDLKTESGRAAALDAIAQADVLLEGFRPGVMERLGLEADALPPRHDKTRHGELAASFQQRFATLEACVTPVLSLREAQTDPVNVAAFAAQDSHRTLNIPRTAPHLISSHLTPIS